ncbi:MAG TPA: SGNH/GDSL hydrolase family protein, partial [Bryobacteraceae bacterium]|nr:SGNH/GDSL hydrolase family protein [Bryobacteraceae bacterium]
MIHPIRAASIAAFSLILFGQAVMAQRSSASSAGDTHWVATWAAAEQQPRAIGPGRGRGPAPAANAAAVPSAPSAPPAAPRPAPPPSSFQNQTLRMIVRTSLGGNRLRVHLSNVFGAMPLQIGAAHIALRSMDSAIVPGSDRPLTFNGKTAVMVPAGAEVLSDTVELNAPKLTDLAVSVFVPGETGLASVHSLGLHTTYISKEGDFTAAPQIADATTSQAWYWVSGIDVTAPADAAAIVTFGDSITDGATSTANTDRSWPSVLAARLQANPATAKIAVINEGISGNRVLGDGAGVSALARFDRDVIAQAGVKWVMIMEGINDIGLGARNGTISSDALIGAMRQMIERAHTHGIKVIGCTLTPYSGASYSSEEGEVMRTALNTFIRTPGNFDAFVDFEQVTRDPANPKQFAPGFNNTD